MKPGRSREIRTLLRTGGMFALCVPPSLVRELGLVVHQHLYIERHGKRGLLITPVEDYRRAAVR